MTTMELERELREFWSGYEATRSAFGRPSRRCWRCTPVSRWGQALRPAGTVPEIIDQIAAGCRVYRALRRLETADVVVL